MKLPIKIAVVCFCFALCAVSVFFVGGKSETRKRPMDRATPVLLRQSRTAPWLLV